MKRTKFNRLFLLFTILMTATVLTSCVLAGYYEKNDANSEGQDSYEVYEFSEGLEFTLLHAEKAYEVSMGSCTETNIIIPPAYKGLPVTRIAYGAFSNTDIESVEIPSSITHIVEIAFSNCSRLTNVTIPEGVVYIGENAFNSCTALTDVSIPDSLRHIGKTAFANCTALSYNEYDNGLYLGNENNKYVLLDKVLNNEISEISIHSQTKHITNDAFERCSSLAYNEYEGGLYVGNSENPYVFLVDTVEDQITSFATHKDTRFIGSRAFEYCENLSSVTLSDNIVCIGEYAFNSCSSLTDIKIPSKVASIQENAFFLCEALEKIVIPDSVLSVGKTAFTNCFNLSDVTLSENLIRIDENVFQMCESIENITIPKKVTSIGYEAFMRCTGLTSITFPDGVTYIDDQSFYGCTSLESISFSKNLKYVGISAFSSCSQLENIVLPKGTVTIENNAFSSCSKLTSITIPESVTFIEKEAFKECQNLKTVIFEGTVEQFKAINEAQSAISKIGTSGTVKCSDGNISYQ
ncbi:MAG: leucine-rich repeat domain-containing protein [Ruminococcaceae bacterium]|nr:leucine-rich repeat domain-containing protein [Oscillospiraceae bacterium]